eukprot:jgi/Mesvir1/17839/Mv12927-RA.1
MEAYALTFPGRTSQLWEEGLPSRNVIVKFQHGGSDLVTLCLPRTSSESEILAVLNDITGIPASAIELIWPQRAVQSAEFPLKSFIYDCGGVVTDAESVSQTFDCILADARWTSSLTAQPTLKPHPCNAVRISVA